MDDKKKMIVVGVLFLVMIAVGVMMFKPSGEQAPAPAKKEEVTAADLTNKVAVETDIKNPGLTPTGSRDPFAIPLSPIEVVDHSGLNGQRLAKPKPLAGMVRPTGLSNLASELPKAGADGNQEGPKPEPVKPVIPPFSYTVAGVVIGRFPAVVFKDPQGNQKLVSQGAQLDPDTKVESISLKFVTVSYHGATRKVPVGETQQHSEGGSVVK